MGINLELLSLTADIGSTDNFFASQNHWSVSHGSITTPDLSPYGMTICCFSSLINKFISSNFFKISFLASNRSKFWNSSGTFEFSLAFSSKILINSKSCLFPTSKSLKSCAGVIFTAPEPFSGSAYSSAMIGIFLFEIGKLQNLPIRFLYFSSSGWTATAVSPNIVSGLVVATMIWLFSSIGYLICHKLPSVSLCSTSRSEIAVKSFGSQLTNLLSL